MTKLIWVLIGGAIGTGCRYGVSLFIYSLIKPVFPYATLLINISGSFAIGLLAELFDTKWHTSPIVRATVLVGVLGGYTTFSSFSLETLTLLRDSARGLAFLYVAGSVMTGLIAVWAGMRVAQMIS